MSLLPLSQGQRLIYICNQVSVHLRRPAFCSCHWMHICVAGYIVDMSHIKNAAYPRLLSRTGLLHLMSMTQGHPLSVQGHSPSHCGFPGWLESKVPAWQVHPSCTFTSTVRSNCLKSPFRRAYHFTVASFDAVKSFASDGQDANAFIPPQCYT